MSLFRPSASPALVLLLALAPLAAEAQDVDALLDEGVALREQGRDQEALERFERAYQQSHASRALAQVALAEQALGRWVLAEQHLSTALAQPDAWVTERRALLEQGLARIRAELGRVELVGGPEGAEVSVEGRVVGQLPLSAPLQVQAGTVGIEVRARGYLPFRRSVDVAAGRSARLEVSMQPGADGGGGGGQSDDVGLMVGIGTSYAVGGVGLILFGTLGGVALGEYQAAERSCGASASCSDADVAAIRDLSAGADAMLAVGLVGIVTGTALLIAWLASGRPDQAAAGLRRGRVEVSF